jgi:hypothetical protein
VIDEPQTAPQDEPLLEQPTDGSTQLEQIREEKARMSLEAEAKMQEANAVDDDVLLETGDTPPDAPIDQAVAADDDDDSAPETPFSFTTHAQAESALREWKVEQSEIDGWINMSVRDKTAALNEYFGL